MKATDVEIERRCGGPAPNASDVGTDTNPDVPKPDVLRPASCLTNG